MLYNILHLDVMIGQVGKRLHWTLARNLLDSCLHIQWAVHPALLTRLTATQGSHDECLYESSGQLGIALKAQTLLITSSKGILVSSISLILILSAVKETSEKMQVSTPRNCQGQQK